MPILDITGKNVRFLLFKVHLPLLGPSTAHSSNICAHNDLRPSAGHLGWSYSVYFFSNTSRVNVCVFWLLNVTINDISVVHMNANRWVGGLRKTLDLRSAPNAIDISSGFFNVPVLAPTRGRPLHGYSEKPFHSVAFYDAHGDTEDLSSSVRKSFRNRRCGRKTIISMGLRWNATFTISTAHITLASSVVHRQHSRDFGSTFNISHWDPWGSDENRSSVFQCPS